MSDTDVDPRQFHDIGPPKVTLDDLAQRMDVLGQQMNWLCENLQSLFSFVNAMGNNGGGIRGLMKTLKQQEALEVTQQPGVQSE